LMAQQQFQAIIQSQNQLQSIIHDTVISVKGFESLPDRIMLQVTQALAGANPGSTSSSSHTPTAPLHSFAPFPPLPPTNCSTGAPGGIGDTVYPSALSCSKCGSIGRKCSCTLLTPCAPPSPRSKVFASQACKVTSRALGTSEVQSSVTSGVSKESPKEFSTPSPIRCLPQHIQDRLNRASQAQSLPLPIADDMIKIIPAQVTVVATDDGTVPKKGNGKIPWLPQGIPASHKPPVAPQGSNPFPASGSEYSLERDGDTSEELQIRSEDEEQDPPGK
jgi:hypothetical protein